MIDSEILNQSLTVLTILVHVFLQLFFIDASLLAKDQMQEPEKRDFPAISIADLLSLIDEFDRGIEDRVRNSKLGLRFFRLMCQVALLMTLERKVVVGR